MSGKTGNGDWGAGNGHGVCGAALALAVLLAGAPAAVRAQDEIGIPLGATPPAVQLENLDGRATDLTAFVGKKPVLIEFWATWCTNCRALLPRMRTAHQRYGREVEFVVIGVAVNQSRNSVRRHLAEHALPFRFFYDATGSAVRGFQAPATSYVVALDARGRVVYTGLGPDQDIEAAVRRALGND